MNTEPLHRDESRSYVIDFDGHVIEPWEMWHTYIADAHKPMAPRMVRDAHGMARLEIEGRVLPTPDGFGRAPRRLLALDEIAGYRARLRGGADPVIRLQDMDEDGIDIAVLLPSQGLAIGAVQDPGLAAAMSRAYNNWLFDYCQACPSRLIGVAMLPLQDVSAAVEELTRASSELKFRAAFCRPNPILGRTLADPCYGPLYDALQTLGLPLLVHEGCGFAPGATAAIDRFANGFFNHCISHTVEQMLASLTIICGGVLEAYPRLKCGFLESGCTWLPPWLERMDEHYETLPHEVPWLTMPPSKYFERQCFISCESHEAGLAAAIDRLGVSSVVFASDYPHSDHHFPSVAPVRARADLSENVKRHILGENAAAILGLAPHAGAPRPVVSR